MRSVQTVLAPVSMLALYEWYVELNSDDQNCSQFHQKILKFPKISNIKILNKCHNW